MANSMTGFASETGAVGGISWTIELRGVNAKGLDIRLRLPEQMNASEANIRKKLQQKFQRGSLSVSLKTETTEGGSTVIVNPKVLDGYLNAAIQVRTMAKNKGLKLPTSEATDFLNLRGVCSFGETESTAFPDAEILASLDRVIASFASMRASEGTALQAVMQQQLAQIESLVSRAAATVIDRQAQTAESFKANLARVMSNADGVDAARLAQELAMLAVKADISEELDRLAAHVVATRELLGADGPIGRKLDFLMQEFNREANTLCSKSGSTELTRVGLDLKAVIDQMREQVQNVE